MGRFITASIIDVLFVKREESSSVIAIQIFLFCVRLRYDIWLCIQRLTLILWRKQKQNTWLHVFIVWHSFNMIQVKLLITQSLWSQCQKYSIKNLTRCELGRLLGWCTCTATALCKCTASAIRRLHVDVQKDISTCTKTRVCRTWILTALQKSTEHKTSQDEQMSKCHLFLRVLYSKKCFWESNRGSVFVFLDWRGRQVSSQDFTAAPNTRTPFY